jgi:hypothetical protein
MANSASFQHLGSFSDLVDYVQMVRVSEERYSHENLSQRIGDVLAIGVGSPEAQDLRVHSTWSNRGLRCEEVSWSVGHGPRTLGWVLRPDNNAERLPGVLALHGHDGVKWYGKEKIADGIGPTEARVSRLREQLYEGRAFANILAAEGS